MIACSIPICYWLYKKTSVLFSLTALFVYFRMSQAVFPVFNDFTIGDPDYRLKISAVSAMSFIALSSLVLAALNIREKSLRAILSAVPVYGVINSLYVIAGWYWGFGKFVQGVGISGFLDYSGMNGVLIALCAIPLLSYPLRGANRYIIPVAWVLNLSAIVLSKSSIPYGVLACGIAAYFLCERRMGIKAIAIGACAVVGTLVFAYLFERSGLFDSAKRFHAYQVFMGTWWNSKFVWLGTGPGTFMALSREIQLATGFEILGDGRMYSWKWIHSDYPLQTFFEWGVVGGILCGAVLIEILYKLYARNEKAVFALAIGLLSSAVFNFPCRYSITALLIAYCVGAAYYTKQLPK